MAVQAIEVASVGEVPDNSYRSTSGLRISQSEVGDSFDDAEHALADQWVSCQMFDCGIIDFKAKEQEAHQRR